MQFTITASARRALLPIAVIAACFSFGPGKARADGVPANLASMAKDLVTGSRAELERKTGDPKQDAIRQRARDIIRAAGVRYWARDPVRAKGGKDLPHRHRMTLGDNDDQLNILWRPEKNDLEVQIRARESSRGAGDGFELLLHGDVASKTSTDDEKILSVEPRAQPVSILTDEERRRLQNGIFGKWIAADGSVWEIAPGSASSKDAPPKKGLQDSIEELERRIAAIAADKVFRWKNTGTGETVVQEKFRKLGDRFDYLGEGMRDPDGEKKIAQIRKRIATLRAAAKPLPVEKDDPTDMNKLRKDANAQTLHIRVTETDGYSWTYDQAFMAAGRITARRTLHSLKDSPRLPAKVMQQAIASFSPPEWVELDMRIDVTSREIRMEGLLWRMKVTYSGDDLTVKRVHTPWHRDLTLQRSAIRSAEGAAVGMRL